MRSLVILLLAMVHLIAAPAAQANTQLVEIESWTEQWDARTRQWVRIDEESASKPKTPSIAQRFDPLAPVARADVSGPRYGPFKVLDAKHAALIAVTDRSSPGYFSAMLRDHPGLEWLEMIEAPGTRDDLANLALGRMIRSAGISTHVPRGGSVRSGAVELFLSGVRRRIDDGAQFAVHSWLDIYGREPADLDQNSPENRLYLDYYREMGMSAKRALAFYTMTNSVPNADAMWLNAEQMREWIAPMRAASPPKLALLRQAQSN